MPQRSHRVPADLSLNRLAAARAKIGAIPFDLTISNPTTCGLLYPGDLLCGLADPRGLRHEPDPRGPAPARAAVAAVYHEWGCSVDPERVFLTASTSEAYGFLFRLLLDPGETVAVPAPSYPLFEHLTRLDGVRVASYGLDPDAGWRLEFGDLERAPAGTRAVVVVHPNNPTGSYLHPDDGQRLRTLCRDRDWALVADEVFLPYPLDGGPGAGASHAEVDDCLCFTLGGLSKSAGLPQLKMAWVVVSGRSEEVRSAVEGLEYVADAYLPVSTPVALASPQIMALGESVRAAISTRCRANLAVLRSSAERTPAVAALPSGGGWNAVLRVPALSDDETLCVHLLEAEGVAVLPGTWFEFPRSGYLVLSLLTPEDRFAEGCRRLIEHIDRAAGGHGRR